MAGISWKISMSAVAALALGATALGSGTYYNLGASRSPTGVSGDGSVVAGTTTTGQPYFIWLLSNPGTTTLIGGVSPGSGVGGQAKISNDGTKISGTVGGFVGPAPIPPTVVNQMGVYDVTEGSWTGVGGIGWFSGTETSGGWGMSGDGSTIVGLGWSPNQTNAYAIVSQFGRTPVALPWLVPGRSSRANGCNSDGSVVVGWQDNPFGFRCAAVWNNGVGQRLFLSYPTQPLGEAQACSADGTWVVGTGNASTTASQAWRWSQDTGAQLLGELNPAEGWNASATGITADGSMIVGFERLAGPGLNSIGWIWTEADGMQNLTDYVVANGVVLPVGLTLALPQNISADGLTFTGIASDATGFVVRLDPPSKALCAGDINADLEVNISDMLDVINGWGSCPVQDSCPADINADNSIDINDLILVINAWGACPR